MKNIFILSLLLYLLSAVSAVELVNITPEDVHQKIHNSDIMMIVDVREWGEYHSGYIIRAINMPWNSGVLQERYEEIPMDMDIIVVCLGGARSAAAGRFLNDQGVEFVFNMVGGMNAWEWETVTAYGGWIQQDAGDTTFVRCITDSIDWVAFPPGGMNGMMYPDSIYCEFEELDPGEMPWTHDATMIGGYFIDVTDPMGHGMMDEGHAGFMQNVELHFHYVDEMVGAMSEDSMMVRYWDIEGSLWNDVAVVKQDSIDNTILFSQNTLRSYYGIWASPAEPQKGDLNGDGQVNITDVVRVINIILAILDPTPDQSWAADVTEDGSVDIIDAVHMVNMILGINPKHSEKDTRF